MKNTSIICIVFNLSGLFQKAHVPNGPLHCPHCPCRFDSTAARRRHIQVYHVLKGNTNKHWIPVKKLKTESTLKRRLSFPKVRKQPKEVRAVNGYVPTHPGALYIPTETRKYRCEHCGAFFVSKGHLNSHIGV